jgi:cold-inducible RNA-binding protein
MSQQQAKIYVGNLSYNSKETDLENFFSQFGQLSEVKLIKDMHTGRSKGFAFLTFESQESAEKACKEANGNEFQGRSLKVNIAKENHRRSGGGRGGSRFHGHGGGYHQ